jgi:hypothetical protein
MDDPNLLDLPEHEALLLEKFMPKVTFLEEDSEDDDVLENDNDDESGKAENRNDTDSDDECDHSFQVVDALPGEQGGEDMDKVDDFKTTFTPGSSRSAGGRRRSSEGLVQLSHHTPPMRRMSRADATVEAKETFLTFTRRYVSNPSLLDFTGKRMAFGNTLCHLTMSRKLSTRTSESFR